MSENNRNNNDDFKAPDMREIFRQYTMDEPDENTDDAVIIPIEKEENTATEETSAVEKKDTYEDISSFSSVTEENEIEKEPHQAPVQNNSIDDYELPETEPFLQPVIIDKNALPIPEDEFGMPTTVNFAVNLTEQDKQIVAKKEAAERLNESQEGEVKGFKKFLKNIFPWKNDSPGEIIRKCVFIVSITVIIISAAILINDHIIEPNVAENDISDVLDIKNGNSDLTWDDIKKKYPDVDFPEGMQLKYAEIYAKNPDFIGWLTIDKLNLEFPILQTNNNDYYLKRSFNHKYTDLGNPFLNCENSVDPLDLNTIIYGHSTRSSDKIFSKLFDYRTLRGYVNNPVIEFNTIYKDYKWKICAVFITSAAESGDNGYFFNYIFTDLSTEEAFNGYIEELDRRTLYTTGVDIQPTDKLLTLSTCLYDIEAGRLVVVARMVREGESEEVDTSLAKLNSNPYYPQAWYDKKGIKNPYKDVERWYPD